MVSQTPDIELLGLEAAPKQFVTSITKEQAHITGLALFHPVQHVARVLVHRLIGKIQGIERA